MGGEGKEVNGKEGGGEGKERRGMKGGGRGRGKGEGEGEGDGGLVSWIPCRCEGSNPTMNKILL